MKVLKGCSLALVGFLLFLFLSVFGVVYTVHQTALSPAVVNGIIRDVDFAEIAQEVFEADSSGQTAAEQEMQTAVIDTIVSIQPVVKEKLYIAVEDIYAYLLGDSSVPNFKVVLGDSFMNRDFVEKLLAKIDIADLVEQTVAEQTGGSDTADAGQALQQALFDTIATIEPEFKAQVAAASDPIFKYLLGQSSTIDLKTTARNTIISNSFMSTVIDTVDVKSITVDLLHEQLGPMPDGVQLTDNQIERIAAIFEPAVKSNLKTAAGPLADYVIGKTGYFTVTISFSAVLPQLKPIVTEAFLASAPPELEGTLTQAEIDAVVDEYWNDAVSAFPANITLDSTVFGDGMNTGIGEMFSDLQRSLNDARQNLDEATGDLEAQLSDVRLYLNYFRWAFYGIIALLLVLIGLIVLIHREVKGACNTLGIIFTIYGLLVFAGVMVARFVGPAVIENNFTDMPQFIAELVPNLVKHFTGPLFTVSLICLIGGIVLIVVSIIYPKMRAKQTEAPPAPPPAATS